MDLKDKEWEFWNWMRLAYKRDYCCEHGNERLGFQIMQTISWLAEEMPSFGAGV